MKQSINIKGTLMHFDTPKVMGILNVTPDSFSDGGKYDTTEAAVNQALQMLKDGADILDIGGYSSRPGADEVSIQQELDRVVPVIKELVKHTDAVISVDTFRSEVAKQAVAAGAHIVNDISAGEDDEAMLNTVAELGVPYIAMHKQGTPKTMQYDPRYANVVGDVLAYLSAKKEECMAAGIQDIMLDPGFGFGKTEQHNYELLKNFAAFQALGVPLLAGVSRKSMIYKLLGIMPQEAVNGTTFLHAFALQGGAAILRVHDVKEAKECIELYARIAGLE
ncbi:MAG: dihydropteroate synthase [Bacteroidia bacterium]